MTEKKPAARPAAAKKPLDRQPKKLSVKVVEGGKVVTFKQLKILIKDAALRDHRVMQHMVKIRDDDREMSEKVLLNGEMIDRVLGKEQSDKLIDALADKDGFTDFIELTKAFNEILGAAHPNS